MKQESHEFIRGSVKPNCDRGIYAEQISAMEKYLDILADRAEIEKIQMN